jgi:hypothetical protein
MFRVRVRVRVKVRGKVTGLHVSNRFCIEVG